MKRKNMKEKRKHKNELMHKEALQVGCFSSCPQKKK
jgi:hypothetical protein